MRAFLVAGAVLAAASPAGMAAPSPAAVPAPSPSLAAQGPCSPTVTSTLPADQQFLSQAEANCFAWQEFIALNWAASPTACGTPDTTAPASSFGAPGSTSPAVWESYKEASEVYRPGGEAPSAFCAPQALPSAVAAASPRPPGPTSRLGHKALVMPTKFSANAPLDLSEIDEAFPSGAWLTAQNGNLTMYEVRMNEDEYDYVVTNELYDAANQPAVAVSQGINLPDGTETTYGTTGAIEVKAAWLELDDPSLYPMFKTSQAIVVYPGEAPKQVIVGLVGLHIIRKTSHNQQFVWATFEHIANAPDANGSPHLSSYTYNNPTCQSCQTNKPPNPCAPGQSPPACSAYSTPIQVQRQFPIDSGVATLNATVQATIKAANPTSVFANYQLVNVLWPNASTAIGAGATVPLTTGGAESASGLPVANTTLETYVQTTTCLGCHTSAAIATGGASSALKIAARPGPSAAGATTSTTVVCTTQNPTGCASDYSFLFHRAQSSPPAEPETAGDDGGVPVAAIGTVLGVAGAALAGVLLTRRRSEPSAPSSSS